MSELTGIFEAKRYSTQVVNQNGTHAYPLLVAKPMAYQKEGQR
jgi:hypothetical protein